MSVLVLLLGILLDVAVGDPSPNSPYGAYYRIHPTVLMGRFIAGLERRLKNPNPQWEKLNGVFLGLATVLTFGLLTFFGLWAVWFFLGAFSFWLAAAVYVVVGVVLVKFTVCIKLETDWARAAAKAINEGNIVEARKYAHFSRRDFASLDGGQIASGIIESMAENIIDFKFSPIIWYSFLGVAGAVAFRAINTLDGMVGFKDKDHINTGWFSANLDHIVNFIPARLTGALIIASAALLGKDYKNAWRIAKRDHKKTQSRNHGWPMAAMAGALHVQFEKPDKYILGDPTEPLDGTKILDALKIRDVSIVLCLLIFLPVLVAVRLFVFPF
ncbi:MAG: adenosylcobinamide-phosphate synthase CbiB [Candidatus Bathyarchaeota archaeon]|nr:adenosylcobinamide-phosphate synthase CbiB [Candidatus Bathyarchaeota archaeon]